MPDGQVRTANVRLIDFDDPGNNDWLAVNQFTIVAAARTVGPTWWCSSTASRWRLLELKNPANEHATLKSAWNQVQTYRTDIPAVFTPNAVTVISDGTSCGDELVHRWVRALRAVEDDRRSRGRHATVRRSRC